MNRRTQILGMVQSQPGITGAEIHTELTDKWHRDSWLGQRIPRDSLWAIVLSPSIGWIYPVLAELESDGMIRSEWGLRLPGSKHRRRHYHPNIVRHE